MLLFMNLCCAYSDDTSLFEIEESPNANGALKFRKNTLIIPVSPSRDYRSYLEASVFLKIKPLVLLSLMRGVGTDVRCSRS